MALTLAYPTNAELIEIAQDKIATLAADRAIFDIMPMVNVDAALLMWEQKDNYIGLQQARGMNGKPPRVKKVGAKRYIMEPGIYGEFILIDELEITTRRPLGNFSGAVPIDDLVMEAQDLLLGRRLDRMEYIGWKLLATGTFSVSAPNGAVVHTDSYTLQTYNASSWGTPTTATPLLDFRGAQQLSHGHSVSFGPNSKAYMNQATFNKLISNSNAADLYGRRVAGLATVNGMKDLNVILAGEGLPQLVIYDLGYLDDAGSFQLWIPNDVVIIVGQRPANQPVMDYAMVRNANNPSLEAGPYQKVVDDEDEVPRSIEVHDGHSGGVRIYFPSAVIIVDVS